MYDNMNQRISERLRELKLTVIWSHLFLHGRFYLKNRQKPTATLIYADNIIYNIYTTYISPPPIINTFFDVKIH